MSMPPNPPGPPAGGYQPGPGLPAGPTSDDRTWALIAHVGALVVASFGLGLLCPLVVMLVKGNESPFVRRHAVESLNFQISLLVYGVVATVVTVVLAVVTLGLGLIVLLPVIFVLLVVALVVIIQATIAASNGREYRYPMTMRLVS